MHMIKKTCSVKRWKKLEMSRRRRHGDNKPALKDSKESISKQLLLGSIMGDYWAGDAHKRPHNSSGFRSDFC